MKNNCLIIKQKHYLLLIFLTLANIISVCLETIGISMLPALLITIVFPNTTELNNYIIDYSKIINLENENFILYFSGVILVFFIFKNFFFIFFK